MKKYENEAKMISKFIKEAKNIPVKVITEMKSAKDAFKQNDAAKAFKHIYKADAIDEKAANLSHYCSIEEALTYDNKKFGNAYYSSNKAFKKKYGLKALKIRH